MTDVLLGVVRDCADQMSLEAREKADTCIQTLSYVRMESDPDKKDTYSANFAGLVCVLRDDHSIVFATTEDSTSDEGTVYGMLGNGNLSSWRINTDPACTSRVENTE